MRINKYVAQSSGISRRRADELIVNEKVTINGVTAKLGDKVTESDTVRLDKKPISSALTTLIMLNKPAGYVTSRSGQGAKTIYELLPKQYSHLKPVGRLDK